MIRIIDLLGERLQAQIATNPALSGGHGRSEEELVKFLTGLSDEDLLRVVAVAYEVLQEWEAR